MMRFFIIIIFSLGLAVSAFGQSDKNNDEREALAIVALEGLMSAPSERALPLVTRVLNGGHSNRVKKRALFVLSQINLPAARDQLIEFAVSSDHDLQREAIRMIGVSGAPDALAELKTIYKSAPRATQKAIVEAYLIANDADAIYELAQETDDEQALENLIRTLGAMGAHEQLRLLSGSNNTSKGLVQAYAIAGDLDSLIELTKHENPEVRVQAIQNIGVIGGARANQTLVDIYTDPQHEDIKGAALEGLMISGDDKSVLSLYQRSEDLTEKSQLLRVLAAMDSDAILEAIDAALDGDQ